MTKLTRRRVLASAATATAATVLAPFATNPSAFGTAAPAGKQAPGFYRYKVGDLEVSVVTDGAATFPLPDKFVQNHSKDEVQQVLAAAYQPTGKKATPSRSTLAFAKCSPGSKTK
jgi:hypothetical protein